MRFGCGLSNRTFFRSDKKKLFSKIIITIKSLLNS